MHELPLSPSLISDVQYLFQQVLKSLPDRHNRGVNPILDMTVATSLEDIRSELKDVWWLLYFFSDGRVSKSRALNPKILLGMFERVSVKVVFFSII